MATGLIFSYKHQNQSNAKNQKIDTILVCVQYINPKLLKTFLKDPKKN